MLVVGGVISILDLFRIGDGLSTGKHERKPIYIKLTGGYIVNVFDNVHMDNIFVVGYDFCFRAELESLKPMLRSNIVVKPFNYEDLLSSYIAVSTIGVTTYELIFSRTPVITIGHIRKNAEAGAALERRYGCNLNLGLFDELGEERFISSLSRMLSSSDAVVRMRKKQSRLIDGKGLDRIGEIVSKLCSS